MFYLFVTFLLLAAFRYVQPLLAQKYFDILNFAEIHYQKRENPFPRPSEVSLYSIVGGGERKKSDNVEIPKNWARTLVNIVSFFVKP